MYSRKSVGPRIVSLLSGGTVQPENTYSGILKLTGQVWESQKNDKHNTNRSYHQRIVNMPENSRYLK